MSSTLQDLATWAGADFGSALLPESLQQERTEFEPVHKLAPLVDHGLGLMQIGSWIGRQGGIPGWTTLAVRDSESGAIVVLAINSSGDVAPLDQFVLLDQLYPDTTGLAEAFDAG